MSYVAERHVVENRLREVADEHRLHPEVIKGPSRRKDIVRARVDLILRCRDAGIPIAIIATCLNRHPATIRRAAA